LRTISVFPALYPTTDSEYQIQWGTYGVIVKIKNFPLLFQYWDWRGKSRGSRGRNRKPALSCFLIPTPHSPIVRFAILYIAVNIV
jgi:hypothetical protein